jgi:hypothetical protein
MTRRGLFYTGLQTYEDFIFLLATLGNTAIGDADMCIAIVNKYTIYPSYPDIDNCCFRNVRQAAELKVCLVLPNYDQF